jgi:hypothetical protein
MWSCGEVVPVRNGVIGSMSNSFLSVISQAVGVALGGTGAFGGGDGGAASVNATLYNIKDLEYVDQDVVLGRAEYGALLSLLVSKG